jgi:hypothetical protein
MVIEPTFLDSELTLADTWQMKSLVCQGFQGVSPVGESGGRRSLCQVPSSVCVNQGEEYELLSIL